MASVSSPLRVAHVHKAADRAQLLVTHKPLTTVIF